MPYYQFSIIHRASNNAVEPMEVEATNKAEAIEAAYAELAEDNEVEVSDARAIYAVEEASRVDLAMLRGE